MKEMGNSRMTISSEITKLNTNLTNSYTACQGKGATMPTNQNFDNLANTIDSITGGGNGILEQVIEDVLAGNNPVDTTALQAAEEDIAGIIPYNVSTTKTITQNGTYNAVDDNANGYSSVTVNVPTVTPTGTISITQNGTYNVTNYESADVNVPSAQLTTLNVTPSTNQQTITPSGSDDGFDEVNVSAVTSNIDSNIVPGNIKKDVNILGVTGTYEGSGGGEGWLPRTVSSTGEYKSDSSSFIFKIPNDATKINENNALTYGLSKSGVTEVDFNNISEINGYEACRYMCSTCSGLTSLNVSNITTVGSGASYAFGNAFNFCTSLTNVSFDNLVSIEASQAFNYAFQSSSSLASVSFPSLTTIGVNSLTFNNGHFSHCFEGTNVTSLTFPELTAIYCNGSSAAGGTFASNPTIQKMYFPKLDTMTYGSGYSNQTACNNIFNACPNLTELHFAAANQAAIEASPGYSTAWGRGSSNVTIYFDL